MLVGGGLWLGVLGDVFTDKVIVQWLTDFMWCAHSTSEEGGSSSLPLGTSFGGPPSIYP